VILSACNRQKHGQDRTRFDDAALAKHRQATMKIYNEISNPAHSSAQDFVAQQSEQDMLHIQRVVDLSLKPVPIKDGAFHEVIPQPSSPVATPLTHLEQNKLLGMARSVGRLEMSAGSSDKALKGTAFVVGPGVVATNCHVVEAISELGTQGRWQLKSQATVLVDFGEGPEHFSSNEFVVSQLLAYPEQKGLDVALLAISKESADKRNSLPPPLDLSPQKLSRNWGTELELLGLIGYPDLRTPMVADPPTVKIFDALRASGNYAKIYSPGAITSVESLAGFDFVLHIASTYRGQSGSPLIDRNTFKVIGVHACCAFYSPDVQSEDEPLPCASMLFSRPEANEGISSWSILEQKTLGQVLPH